MRLKRAAAVLSAALVVASGLVVGAAPAQAATSSLSGEITDSNPDLGPDRFWENCYYPGAYSRPIQYDLVPFTVTESGTYAFAGTSVPASEVYMGVYDGSFASSSCVDSAIDGFSVDLTAGTSYLFAVWLCNTNCSTDFLGTYQITATGPGSITGWGSGSSAAPSPDWVQAYQRSSSDATCEDGWAPSWDYWANEGTGGWVCVRSVPEYGTE
jgi:hypothetical protein